MMWRSRSYFNISSIMCENEVKNEGQIPGTVYLILWIKHAVYGIRGVKNLGHFPYFMAFANYKVMVA